MARHGKAILEARSQVDHDREHAPAEAIELVKQLSHAKFDESIEVHIRTGLNVRHADEQLRGTIALPNGLGRDVTIAVFAQGDAAREAEQAGADYVGAEHAFDQFSTPWQLHEEFLGRERNVEKEADAQVGAQIT